MCFRISARYSISIGFRGEKKRAKFAGCSGASGATKVHAQEQEQILPKHDLKQKTPETARS